MLVGNFELKEVSCKNIKNFFHFWRIPKELRPVVLKELEDLSLIKKINARTVKIVKSPIDISNTSDIYKRVGLFK